MNSDLFDQFIDLYQEGYFVEALRLIVPHPNIQLESLSSSNKFFKHLVNFADACVFHGIVAYAHIEKILEELNDNNALYELFVEELRKEVWLCRTLCLSEEEVEKLENLPVNVKEFFLFLKKGLLTHEKEIHELMDAFPENQKKLVGLKLQVIKGCELLERDRHLFTNCFDSIKSIYSMPWIPFAYALKPEPLNPVDSTEIPLIFMEPIQGLDYAEYLHPILGKRAILIVETVELFYQILQFPSIHALLDNPHVYFYVLERPAEAQFKSQGFQFDSKQSVEPFFMLRRPHWEAVLEPFTAAFNRFLLDSSDSTWLQVLARKTLFQLGVDRYGKSRFLAYSIESGMRNWFTESRYEKLPEGTELGPIYPDLLKEMIEKNQSNRLPRLYNPQNKIKLTHVVPQLVDGGHAPTRLLNTLCSYADKAWFDVSVFSTERLTNHLMSYPTATFSSESSLNRATKVIGRFQQLGIKVLCDNISSCFESNIDMATKMLKSLQTDIVVFHGPDEINTMIAASCDVPIRLFFDHGTLPQYSCFELLILSTEESYSQNRERFRQMGMESCFIPFSVDVRKDWLPAPYSRKELGLPEEAFIMTTISNHLERRITPEVCHAIVEILFRCPNAFYAPMGLVEDNSKMMAIFESYGVQERVKFLGNVCDPSQVARSMNLYLNEFPFGSGIGILDALAAGCPVVSMYDETGPQQGRYAATYFGIDYVIKTGKKEDYVDLACRLINDKVMYKEWSNHASDVYEKRLDVKQYVKNFELIIEKFVDYYQNQNQK